MPFLRKVIFFSAVAGFFCVNGLRSSRADLSQPAETDVLGAYGTVLPQKSLLSSPQFLVVDDFNEGTLVNQRGALWRTKAPAPGALDLAVEKEDARNPDRGYSLNAQFNLQQNETAEFQSFLNRQDVSAASQLVFKCRFLPEGSEKFSGRLRVSLTDWKQESVLRDVTDFCLPKSGGWGEALLPMSGFKKLDLDQLAQITFTLTAKDAPIQGKLSIDEIAFFGFNEVEFESHRDNLVGYPKIVYDEERRKELLGIRSGKKLLREIAKDTWKTFVYARDKNTQLAVDHIRMGDGPLAADYTSPTNIAMDLLASIAAYDLNFISREDAQARIKSVLETLGKMRRFDGFFYNFYDTKKLNITRSYISSVDSGWLAIALVIVRQEFPEEFGGKASRFLDESDFSEFLDPENNQLVIGFDVPKREFGSYHYGMLATEARATSFYGIGKGDLPKEHWWFLYRTLPQIWDWQTQKPQGKQTRQDGIDYFQGYYEKDGKKFVPSWGGSLFEYLMPTLVLNEKELAKKGLGLNNRIATRLHRDYALIERKYPVWGISPAAVGSGRQWKYEEYGVRALGAKGYRDQGVITPHVSFLALDPLPKSAVENIRNLLKFEKIYGEYGFYDTINLKNNLVNPQYLALDQGMILVAICNYLKKGSIKRRFHSDPIGKAAEELLREDFFKS